MGTGFCSLYCKIHYIKFCYIEVWVYVIFFSFLIAQNELYVGIDFVIANVPMNNKVHSKNEYPDSN